MSTLSDKTFPDAEPVATMSPGTFLAEEIEARGMTQKRLAEAMGRSPKVVNEIIRGKKTITAETALQLEEALGLPASMWVRLEAEYQLSRARELRASA